VDSSDDTAADDDDDKLDDVIGDGLDLIVISRSWMKLAQVPVQ
jgi:hypothetical protein